jgi:glyoxylase-like metal-dependent hydrolase (beta-lactamase superfamily II)
MKEKHFGPVWFMPGKQGGRYPFCHSVYVEGAGIVIDPASDRERLTQLRADPGVTSVWLSHWHEDHLMHLDLFEDVPIWISAPDAPPLSDPDSFMDAYGMDHADERAYWREILATDFHFRPRRPTGFLKEGTEILMDGLTIEVLSTPGHTPGHCAFFFKEQGVLFMGDYDLTKFGPWYGDVDSSIEGTIASIRRLREIPATVWITGHETGLFEDDPGELWDRYLDVISTREEKLLDLLNTPRTLDDIVGAWILYGKPREPKAFFEFGERAHMKKHLEKLIGEGIVKREGNRYVKQ